MKNKIRAFFDAYEKRFNDAIDGQPVDADETAGAFADYFVESSPVGVIGGKNDEQFKAQIPKGFEFYKNIGTISMKIGQLDITTLDAFHAMAKVHWVSAYKGDRQIEFDVYYFLRLLNDTVKVFAYITGDEQQVLKENGLI